MTKFEIEAGELQKTLSIVSMALGKNTVMPILDTIKFNVTKSEVSVVVTDLEISIRSSLDDASISEEGDFCVPAKILISVVKKFNSGLLVEFAYDNQVLNITTNTGEYEIGSFNADEFPAIDTEADENTQTLSSEELLDNLQGVSFAAGTDSLRPVMSGVLFEEGGVYVATDAHRLAVKGSFSLEDANANGVVVPLKGVKVLQRAISMLKKDNVIVESGASNMKFTIGKVVINASLVDGKYPNWRAVVPSDNHIEAEVDAERLKNTVERMSIFANDATHQVRLKFSGNTLSVSADDVDLSQKGTEKIALENTVSEDIEIGFNGLSVSDILSVAKVSKVTFYLSRPDKAAIISAGQQTMYLLMPIMLVE